MVAKHELVKVVLMEISSQLVEIEELQPARVAPADDAAAADLNMHCDFFVCLCS